MAKRDYYEVLSVTRTSTTIDIKKAYKKLALELHPDRNPGDPKAEDGFKEASEAYQILSDEKKRAVYDQHGHDGLRGAGPSGFNDVQDIFTQFQDIFSDFFGGGGGRTRRDGPQRGADLRTVVSLSLREAAFGVKKEVELSHPDHCATCHGTGAKDGARVACQRCGGHGQVAHQRGMFIMQSTCPSCQGAGSTITDPCTECKGRGEISVERMVKVTIPAGIDQGQTLRVPEQGISGLRGGPRGHLYVSVEVEPHEHFQRDGYDLVYPLSISFPEAALGTEQTIDGLDEAPIKIVVPAGIQPGETVTVRSAGVPHLNGKVRGNLITVVQVEVPKKLSSNAKKLLKQLADSLKE
jgi:molecular chaperone DnaJ